ncbi:MULTISPECIES: fatty acid desaturase family protein [Thalassolituus]|jgi:linoleoyl-CoA desaturase|uniref:fatty acid desaturase family protein n=1 Tax=Thalassolituus TaxID=187492 RepID=UPI00042DD356|nr:acyl-CoA desaturase [Thalassolituus oleivorans]AHK15673.1 fatty acid desaturase [Thalassolituus oleivorans R6-15]
MSNIHFPSGQRPVYQQLSALTNGYFKAVGLNKTGDRRLHNKALVILAMYAFSYSALYWLPGNWAMAAWLLHGVATALVGFNIMHDGAHDSFSSSRKLNRLMALTFNLIGSNRFYWAQKHNRNHHAFTNVDEADEDIDALGLFRMSPHQQRRPFHRFQHIYVWFLYLITTLFWFFALDFKAYKSQKIAKRAYSQPMSFGDHAEFWISKAAYLCIYLVLPAMVMTTEQVIWGFLIMHAALGFLFAVVFQLAHVVDKAEFPRPDENDALQDEWAVHQMRTTVDFATNNRFLTWALGGLNFQAEHHLFPRISHVHYPALHPLIEKRAKELGYELRSYPTLWAALAGHYRHLRDMGRHDSKEASSQTDPQTC